MYLYNTLSRQKEPVEESANNPLRMYVCGVTTYDEPHLGHAMSSIVFDVLHRYLDFRGVPVKRVHNLTDVDDKIIERAELRGVSSEELANEHVQSFFDAMDALNIRRADVHPRATQEIPQIIDMISRLIDKGAAYESEGSVYFRVKAYPGYGKLSRRSLDDMLEGAHIDVETGKEHPADFALWKLSKPGEPAWESPWSMGRPGWHIECSAMALHHLGEQIDIHGGGLELVFPHHENEIAQSETALDVDPFVRIWAHNGLLRLSEEKMSKSLGNVITVKEALKSYSPDAIRLWILQSHYRSPLLYDEESIAAAERSMRRLRSAVEAESGGEGEAVDPEPFRRRFIEAMDDDLGTPQAVAAMFDLTREIFRGRDQRASVEAAQGAVRELADILGLSLREPEKSADGPGDDEIEALIARRNEARAEKRYSDADAIREELLAAGIEIQDGPEGTTWSRT